VDSGLVRAIAGDWLGIRLTDQEAVSLTQPLEGLRKLVQTIEEVPLPYSASPFISPRFADAWLDTWPER
jgi:hypothetical protein